MGGGVEDDDGKKKKKRGPASLRSEDAVIAARQGAWIVQVSWLLLHVSIIWVVFSSDSEAHARLLHHDVLYLATFAVLLAATTALYVSLCTSDPGFVAFEDKRQEEESAAGAFHGNQGWQEGGDVEAGPLCVAVAEPGLGSAADDAAEGVGTSPDTAAEAASEGFGLEDMRRLIGGQRAEEEWWAGPRPGRPCKYCPAWQPLRARHCKNCGRCVRRFDHHCAWLGRCVGEGNHCRFFWYLWVQGALLAFVLRASLSSYGHAQAVFDASPLWFLTQLWASFALIVLTAFVSVMALYHTYLAFTAQTTYEFTKAEHLPQFAGFRGRCQHPFGAGPWKNLVSFCWTGPPKGGWVLPPPPPPPPPPL